MLELYVPPKKRQALTEARVNVTSVIQGFASVIDEVLLRNHVHYLR